MNDKKNIADDAPLMTLSEVAAYLKVAEKTVMRMVQRGEVPAVKVAGQWRFVRGVLDDWLMTGMRGAASEELHELRAETAVPRWLSRLIPEGGIVTDLKPTLDRPALFATLVKRVVKAGLVDDGEDFVSRLLERESILTTAVGGGIALPHTRCPAARSGRNGVVIGISPKGIGFGAPDGLPVHVFVLLCADSVPNHLEMMVQVALALRDVDVVRVLRESRQPRDVLAALIEYDQRRLFGRLASHAGAVAGRG